MGSSQSRSSKKEEEKRGPAPQVEVPRSMAELLLQRWASLEDGVARPQRVFNHDVITVILGYCDVEAFRAARCVSQLWMRAACTMYQSSGGGDAATLLPFQLLFPVGHQLLETRKLWADRSGDPLTKWRAVYEPGHGLTSQLLPSVGKLDIGIDGAEIRFPSLNQTLNAPHAIYTTSTDVSFERDEERTIAANSAGNYGHFRIWINDECVMSRGRMRGAKRKKLLEGEDGDGKLTIGPEEEDFFVDDGYVADDRVILYTFRKDTTYRVRAEADGHWKTSGWFLNFNTQPYTNPRDTMKTLRRITTPKKPQVWCVSTFEVSGKQQILVKLPKTLPSDGVILFLSVTYAVEWVFETAPRDGRLKAIVYSQRHGPSACALRSLDGSVVSEHVFHIEKGQFNTAALPPPFDELGSVSKVAPVTYDKVTIQEFGSAVADFSLKSGADFFF